MTFEQDTTVKFNFLGSHGMFKSSLGIYEVDNNSTPSIVKTLFSEIKRSDNNRQNEWQGTLGNTVLDGEQVFTFLANKIYTLGLDSGDDGTVYSTSTLNTRSTQQAVFGPPSVWDGVSLSDTRRFPDAGQFTDGLSAVFNGGALISLDDRGNGDDADFQDFTVTAAAVPEPMTMTGLALGLGGLVAARRRRGGSKTAS
jgi:hypothetical protein